MGKKDKPRPDQVARVRKAVWGQHLTLGGTQGKDWHQAMCQDTARLDAVRRNSTPKEIKEGEKQARALINEDNRWRRSHG